MGFDRHSDMQKLIPQTQLLMCRIQVWKRDNDTTHRPAGVLLPSGRRSDGKRGDRRRRVTGTVLYLLASTPPYFCNETRGCAKDRAGRRAVCIVLGECREQGSYRRDGQQAGVQLRLLAQRLTEARVVQNLLCLSGGAWIQTFQE